MPRDAFVLKIQRELCKSPEMLPKIKVSDFRETGPKAPFEAKCGSGLICQSLLNKIFSNRNPMQSNLLQFAIHSLRNVNERSPHVRESGFQNPCTNFSLLKFGILGFRIRNPDLGIRNPANDWNPECNRKKKLKSSPFGNPESTELESGIYSVESRIQDCHGFPHVGRERVIYLFVWQLISFFDCRVVEGSGRSLLSADNHNTHNSPRRFMKYEVVEEAFP